MKKPYEGHEIAYRRMQKKTILSEIRKAGFRIKLFRYAEPAGEDPFGTMSVGAMK